MAKRFIGVHWNRKAKAHFQAKVPKSVAGRQIYVGSYMTNVEAAYAVDCAMEHFGHDRRNLRHDALSDISEQLRTIEGRVKMFLRLAE